MAGTVVTAHYALGNFRRIQFTATEDGSDGSFPATELPRIQGSLSATQDQMTWVLTSYIIAAAIMTPLSGWLAGQVGRKRVQEAFELRGGVARRLVKIQDFTDLIESEP